MDILFYSGLDRVIKRFFLLVIFKYCENLLEICTVKSSECSTFFDLGKHPMV